MIKQQTVATEGRVENRNNKRGVAVHIYTVRRRLPRPPFRNGDPRAISLTWAAILRLGGGGRTERWRRRRTSLLEFELR
jgi:hypothetical protein